MAAIRRHPARLVGFGIVAPQPPVGEPLAGEADDLALLVGGQPLGHVRGHGTTTKRLQGSEHIFYGLGVTLSHQKHAVVDCLKQAR